MIYITYPDAVLCGAVALVGQDLGAHQKICMGRPSLLRWSTSIKDQDVHFIIT